MIPERLRRAVAHFWPERPETPLMRRAREALELQALGYDAYAQRMRRGHPEATEDEIAAMVWRWRLEPPREPFLSPPPRKGNNASMKRGLNAGGPR